MTRARARWVVDPVKSNESQASEHENNSSDEEDQCLERKKQEEWAESVQGTWQGPDEL